MSAGRVPDLPDACQVDRLIADWCAAEAAFRNRDARGVADAFTPRELGEVDTFTRLVGLTTLAAQVCGADIRKQHSPNPLGFYGLAVEDITTGCAVDPFAGMDEANVVAAGRMVVAAANLDHDQVHALVQAHLRFDGAMERSGVLLDLLRLHCAMTPGVEASA